jgi:hypothetical protein
LTTKQLHYIYHLRDASEKQFAILKTQLGFNVTRVYQTESVRNKFFACFISSIIRNEIMKASQKLACTTSKAIQDVGVVECLLQKDNTYTAIHAESTITKRLLAKFDITLEDFDNIVSDWNIREETTMVSQVRKKPTHPKARKKGRPTGSKNKSTINADTEPKEPPVKRKKGRPAGSKNKPKTDKLDEPKETPVKLKKGRPTGSKNKPKVDVSDEPKTDVLDESKNHK